VNGSLIEINLAEAAALFPTIRDQLSIDGCARTFFVNDSEIETADIRSLQLFLSGETILAKQSLGFLSGLFGNVSLQRLFLDCSKAVNLSDLMIEKRIDLELLDVSILSVEALDSLLLNEFVRVRMHF
jgi:hypothetical protein